MNNNCDFYRCLSFSNTRYEQISHSTRETVGKWNKINKIIIKRNIFSYDAKNKGTRNMITPLVSLNPLGSAG